MEESNRAPRARAAQPEAEHDAFGPPAVQSSGAPGRRALTSELPDSQESDDARAVAALARVEQNLHLIEQQLDGLALAIDARDFAAARLASSSISALQPGLTGSLAGARRAGIEPAQLRQLEEQIAELMPRLEELQQRAPAISSGREMQLEGGDDEAQAVAWQAALGDDVGPASEPAANEPAAATEAPTDGTSAFRTLRRPWLVEQEPAGPGQLTRADFLGQLRIIVTEAASAALGEGWSANDCPYLERYLARYGSSTATELQLVIRKFVPGAASSASAAEVLPRIAARVTAGIAHWQTSKTLPPELAAVEPEAPTDASAAATEAGTEAGTEAAPGAAPADAPSQPTLGGLRRELGAGAPLDAGIASCVGGALGANLDHVRVHSGAAAARKAAEADAAAFVVGGELVLGANLPGGLEREALMAHELAHAAEQRDAALAPDAASAPIGGEEAAAEERADRASASALARLLSGARRLARKAAELISRPLAMQRCATAEVKTSTRDAYLREHALEIAQTAADHVKTLPFATHDPSVAWQSGGATAFAERVAEGYRQRAHPEATVALVRPDEIGHLIDTSRPMDAGSADGQRAYFEGVGLSVGNALARRIDESLRREIPRYAQARYHGGTSSHGATSEPRPDDVIQSHPMDALVVGALTSGSVATLDAAAFAKAHPELALRPATGPKQSRPVKLEPAGSPRWHRLIEPLDATPEEIALALTGSATEAFRIEDARPLFGLSDEFGSAPQTLAAGSALSDEAALAQAGALGAAGSGHPPARILEAMRLNATIAGGSLLELARRFGLGSSAQQLSREITERADRLTTATSAEVSRWDRHTDAQRVILQQVARGLAVCGLRLDSYSTGYGVDLKADLGAFGLPHGHRVALRESAEAWISAAAASHLPTSAEHAVQAAAQRALTLDVEILEGQLADPQAAAHAATESETVAADFDPDDLSRREVALRKRLGKARAQLLADPSPASPADQADQDFSETGEAARDLHFESHLVQNATALDSAWAALDDADGFWSTVTFDSGELGRMKAEGKRYYAQWAAIRAQWKSGKKTEARKAFEQLAASKAFQSFLDRAQQLMKDVAKHQMIAKIIAMVVITVASMGAGAAMSGFVGGTTVAEGVVVGGLAMGRTAGAIAGFVTEAAAFTLASNLAFSKDHSLGALAGEFAKNLLLFGALRAVGLGVRAAGFGEMIKAGSQVGATTSAKLGKTAAQVFEMVAQGEAGIFFALVEGKVRQAIGGKAMSQEEIDEVVKMTIIQTVIFAVVGRLAQSPLKQLEAKGALAGERFRLARAEAAALEKLALSLQHGNDAAAALEVVQRDRALIQRELALYQELLALGARDPKALERTGLTAEAINQQIKQLEGFAGTAGGIGLSLAMKQVTPNHFQCPRAHIDEVLAAHRKSGATVEPPSAADPATGARTWTVTPRDGGGKVFVTEEMPSWSITASGKRIVAALAKVGMSEGAIYRRTDVETFPLLEVDRAVATGDAEAANRLVDRAPGLDATVKAAVVKALIEAHALPEDVRARMLKERSEIRWQMEKKNSDLIKKGKRCMDPVLA